MKICHISTVHTRQDIRIFCKELISLSRSYDTSFIVADGKGNEIVNNIKIYDVGLSYSRWNRIINASMRALNQALELDATLYHLHDPELLTIAMSLKKRGKKVIFDAHEDFLKQLMSKPYLNKFVALCISKIFSYYEAYICSRIDAIIAATPTIGDKFKKINNKVIDINNYPLLGELESTNKDWDSINDVCYIGGISEIRGIYQIVEAMSRIKTTTKLNLVGTFREESFYHQVSKSKGWMNTVEFGQLTREGVKEVLSRSVAGIVTFLPAPNHIESQPNKMFEYMSAGIPVIASNYPLWKTIIEGSNCGICVNPENVEEIALAISSLIENKELAKQLGENGKMAIVAKYNWDIEAKKLTDFYRTILGLQS